MKNIVRNKAAGGASSFWMMGPVCCLVAVAFGCSRSGIEDISLIDQRRGTNSYLSIRAECRALMPSEKAKMPMELAKLEKEDVSITLYPSYANFSNIISSVIRDLDVTCITVNRDFVTLSLRTSGRRVTVLVFREGVEEFGTAEIEDGLWYWNGSGGFPRFYPVGIEWGYHTN